MTLGCNQASVNRDKFGDAHGLVAEDALAAPLNLPIASHLSCKRRSEKLRCMDDDRKGCIYALLGLGAIWLLVIFLSEGRGPDEGPSCLEVYERVRARGGNESSTESSILDRCDRALREERPPGGPYG